MSDDRLWVECEDRGRCDIVFLPSEGGEWWCFGCERAATVMIPADADGDGVVG